jgi:hypothetical protein
MRRQIGFGDGQPHGAGVHTMRLLFHMLFLIFAQDFAGLEHCYDA